MLYTTRVASPVGNLFLAAEEKNLVGLWLEGQKYFGYGISEPFVEQESHPVLLESLEWLERYFFGEQPDVSQLPLAPRGSEFRKSVWKILCTIPYGKTVTYGEIAGELCRIMGRDHMSAQAVGGAVGHNPISILIPCHRVVGTDGRLTGYAGGVEKKRWLLEHEGVKLSPLSKRGKMEYTVS